MNGIGELQDDTTYSIRYDKQGLATVTEHHKLKGTLWERMELQHFPVDVQELSLSITTSHTDLEMKFIKDLRKPSGVNRHIFTDEQEWYLFEHVDIEITQEIDEYLDDGHNHSVITCSCHAARLINKERNKKTFIIYFLFLLENLDISCGMHIFLFFLLHPQVLQHFQFHYQSKS
jgi:hypothetical protein